MKETVRANLEEFVGEAVESGEFSGVVEIRKNGKRWWSFESGMADEEKEEKNTLETRFNIGSMDKMFTAVAIAQLVEKGELSFEDEVADHVSRLPESYKGVAIDHVLTHREGCPSYFNDKYIQNRQRLKTVDDYLDLFVDSPLLFQPGTQYQYSNSGYVLLGAVIEQVSGMSYSDYLRKHVFLVAGMSSTCLDLQDVEDVAKGYTHRRPFSRDVTDRKRTNEEDLPLLGSPAGGGFSTCGDLHKFARALFDYKLLGEEKTNLVTSPKVEVGTKNGQTLHYGYGFQILDVGGGNLRVGHAGSFAGANSRLDVYPWLGFAAVVLANIDEPAAFRVANEFGRLILEN